LAAHGKDFPLLFLTYFLLYKHKHGAYDEDNYRLTKKMSLEQSVVNLPESPFAAAGNQSGLAEVIELHPAVGEANYGLRPLIHGAAPVEGGATTVTYSFSVPEDIAVQTVAIGINGFGAFKRTAREFRNKLAMNEGVPAISYDPLRRSAPGHKLLHALDPQRLHVNTITAIANHLETRRDLPRHVRQLAHEAPYTLIPHSMGELPAVRWLEQDENADKTALIIHLGALGISPLKPREIIRRTTDVLVNDVLPALATNEYGNSPVMVRRAIRYFLSNPAQTAAEIMSCLAADTSQSVRALADMGVPQAIVAMENDDFFYPDEIQTHVGNIVDEIVIIEGRHTAPQRQPTAVAKAVGSIIRRHTS
jgi:hypothetical protein